MYSASRLALFVATSLLLLGTLIPLAQSRAAEGFPIQASLPSPSSQDTLGDIVTNPRDRNIVFGGCEEDPYAALQGEGFIASGARVVPRREGGSLVDGIDPALACRLLQLFRAAKACNPKIGAGYRSKSDQARACIGVCGNPNGCSKGCAPPGLSCHQRGLAVDISSSCAEKMSAAARGYNLISRIPGYPNPNHYQCIEHGRSAGVSSCTGPCQNGLPITAGPDNFQPSGPPSSGISSAARNFLNPQPAPQPPQMPPQALPQSQQPQLAQAPPLGTQNTTPYPPGTCAPQFYCSDNNLYYRASTCVDQVNQVCPNGCSGTSCIASPQSVSDILTSALSSTTGTLPIQTTQKKSTSSLSIFDQIGLFANPTPVGSAAPTEPLVLTVSGEEVARLQGNPAQSGTLPPATTYGTIPLGAQQTFTSSDLREGMYTNPLQESPILRALAIMKETLLRVLDYLRPFGRPSQQEGEYEWAE